MRLSSFALVSGLALLAGCATEPGYDSELQFTLAVDRWYVEPEDTVNFTITAHNPTAYTIELSGASCGHSLAAEVTTRLGVLKSRSWGLPSICELLDDNVLDAGETDTVTWRTAAPAERARYVARAGISRGDHLDRRAELDIEVGWVAR